MSQLSHPQFPLRRHPHLLVDHRRAGSASVADSRGADAERLTGSGGRLHFGMGAGIKSERWPASNRNQWPDCIGIRIFVRLAEPDWHREAITSRPLLLHAIAERVRHARQTTIRIASMHARSVPAAEALRAVAKFLRGLVETAEQLAPLHRWREILSRAFQAFLKGRPLRAPLRLKPG